VGEILGRGEKGREGIKGERGKRPEGIKVGEEEKAFVRGLEKGPEGIKRVGARKEIGRNERGRDALFGEGRKEPGRNKGKRRKEPGTNKGGWGRKE
jgi:hypothetical protein